MAAPKRRKVTHNDGNSSPDIPINPLITDAVNAAIAGLLPDLVTQFVETVIEQVQQAQAQYTGDIGPLPPPPRIYIWLERFQKLNPKSFSTAATPIEARYWISHIEKIFNVLGVEEEFKVRLAAFKLEDDAQLWWEAEKMARGGDTYADDLSWAEFRDLFYKRYFSEAEMRAYRREFGAIRQRDDEPITDFRARFCRLAGLLGEEAGSPEEQADKFKSSVCERFWRLIVNLEYDNISDVVDAVKGLENVWRVDGPFC